MGQYERKPVTTKRGESDWTACRYPDGNPNYYPMGFGETEQQALDDLEEVEGQFDRVCRMNGYRRVELDQIVVSDTAAIDAVCLLSEKGLNWPDKGSKLTCIRTVNSLCKSLEDYKYPADTEDRLKQATESNGLIILAPDDVVIKRKTAETAIKALASVAEIPANMSTVPPSPPDWRVGCDDEIGAICDLTAALGGQPKGGK